VIASLASAPILDRRKGAGTDSGVMTLNDAQPRSRMSPFIPSAMRPWRLGRKIRSQGLRENDLPENSSFALRKATHGVGSGKDSVDRQPPTGHGWFRVGLLARAEYDRLIG